MTSCSLGKMFTLHRLLNYIDELRVRKALVICAASAETKTSDKSIEVKNTSQTASMAEEKVYGGCEGPDSMYVKLIAADGHVFIIKREHAFTSGTIRNMLTGPSPFAESDNNEVHFREISSHVLQKVCQYLGFKFLYADSRTEIPNFEIDAEVALGLLMAANFLGC